MNLETTVIGVPLLTSRDAHECLNSCNLISLTPALIAISPYIVKSAIDIANPAGVDVNSGCKTDGVNDRNKVI